MSISGNPHGVIYRDNNSNLSYVEIPNYRRISTMLGGGPVDWISKKLPMDSPGQSSHMNEYMAAAAATKTCQWMKFLLEEMGLGHWVSGPISLYGDNDMCTKLMREDIVTPANRYYKKELHFNKIAYERGWTNPLRVPGKHNLADVLTKSLGQPVIEYLVPMMTGYAEITSDAAPDPHVRTDINPGLSEDHIDHHLPAAVRIALQAV